MNITPHENMLKLLCKRLKDILAMPALKASGSLTEGRFEPIVK